MSVVTQPPDFRIPRLPVHRFSVAEYHQMIETGILDENDNVELLEGLIVPKMPRNPPHDGVLWTIDDIIRNMLPPNWKVWGQSAITTEYSEPEPDVGVVRGPMTIYFSRHPQAADMGLVVEVSDSTLNIDRHDKGPIYATAGIPYYWIVNILDQVIEVYSDPDQGAYRSRTDYGKGQMVPLNLDGQEVGKIAVQDIFAGL